MKKIPDATESDALHAELSAALSDLAKSVEFAIKRRALRTKITTTMVDAKKVSDAAAELRAAAHVDDVVRQDPAGILCQAPAMPEQAQERFIPATLVPDAATTAADPNDTWVRSALDSGSVDEHQHEKNSIAASAALEHSTQGQGPVQDISKSVTSFPDRASSRANVQDSWVRWPVHNAGKRRSRKRAKAITSILEVYDQLGAVTPKR